MFVVLFVSCSDPCQDAYRDLDLDGYGDADQVERQCEVSAGWVREASDCDNHNPDVHPGRGDPCNGVDDNCDGKTDPTAEYWYVDSDLDGFGEETGPHRVCPEVLTKLVIGWVATGGDCDDANAGVYPGAAESCDGVDEDCDGMVDVSDAPMDHTVLLWADADGDGAGDPLSRSTDCGPGNGWVANFGDCDDADSEVGACGLPVVSVNRTLDLAASRLTGGPPVQVQIPGDLDGDGFGDLAVSVYGGMVSMAVRSGGPMGSEDWAAGADLVLEGALIFPAPTVRALPESWFAVLYEGQCSIYTGPLPRGGIDPGTADWALSYQTMGDIRAAGDPNGDGVTDLWYLSDDTLQLLSATPEAPTVQAALGVSHPTIATGDLTGDGLLEVVTAESSVNDGGFFGAGKVFIQSAPFVDGVASALADTTYFGDDQSSQIGRTLELGGDLDGDGLVDLLLGTATDYAATVSRPAPGSGPIVPAATTLFVVAGSARLVASGDLDGDGATDAVLGGNAIDETGARRPQVFVAYGPVGPGTIDAADLDGWGGPVGAEDPLLAVGDLTGDGKAEIAVGIFSSDLVYVVGAP